MNRSFIFSMYYSELVQHEYSSTFLVFEFRPICFLFLFAQLTNSSFFFLSQTPHSTRISLLALATISYKSIHFTSAQQISLCPAFLAFISLGNHIIHHEIDSRGKELPYQVPFMAIKSILYTSYLHFDPFFFCNRHYSRSSPIFREISNFAASN